MLVEALSSSPCERHQLVAFDSIDSLHCPEPVLDLPTLQLFVEVLLSFDRQISA